MTIRAVASWTVYGLGCTAWWLEEHFFGYLFFERRRFVINLSIYPIYNRLIVWAAAIQGPSGNGPWDPAP